MHLTNYAINRTSEKFVFNADASKADVGNKRSISWFLGWLKECGKDPRVVWDRIGHMIAKTLVAAQPMLSHVYRYVFFVYSPPGAWPCV